LLSSIGLSEQIEIFPELFFLYFFHKISLKTNIKIGRPPALPCPLLGSTLLAQKGKDLKHTRWFVPAYLLFLMGLLGSAICGQALGTPVIDKAQAPRAVAQLDRNFGRLPLYFIENRGQVAPQVKFYQRGAGEAIFFTQEGIGFSLRRGEAQARIAGAPARPGSERFLAKKRQAIAAHQPSPALVQLTPVGMQPQVKIAPADPQEARFNYFLGNDPKKWQTDVPSYGAVVYREAYPGIDLKFYGAARQLEYDIIVRPGADPDLVKFHYAGIKSLTVTPTGDLAIKLPDGGELLQKKPVVYQEIAGVRVAREGKFRVGPETAGHVYSFEVAAYDRTAPLVIDPVLVYSTYLGGSGYDQGSAIAVDGQGCAYVTGLVASPNLGTAGALKPNLTGDNDAFVAKLNAAGNALVFFTYLGGSASEYGQGICVGSDGIYVTGTTYSSDFPLHNALPAIGSQNQKLGEWTAFVTQLAASGDSLVYSTYLGGQIREEGAAITVDGAGNAYIAGYTNSSDFPTTTGAYQNAIGGDRDAFLTKLSPAKIHVISLQPLVLATYPDLLISTFFGGSGWDQAKAIALDDSGKIYIAGDTQSPNFPTLLPYSGYNDWPAYVACFDPSGSLYFSTCLGSSAEANSVAVDRFGGIYVAGYTAATDFPVLNAFQGSLKGGGSDAFVTKLNPPVFVKPFPDLPGAWLPVSLAYSTYLGGAESIENVYGIAVDSQGCASVVGNTYSSDFPTRNPWQAQKTGDSDAFVTKLAADGRSLVYSTFLGGGEYDTGRSIALDASGNAYITGYAGAGFPIRNPFQTNFGGDRCDVFVAKISQPVTIPLLLLLEE
jgi:hypothetical protein